MDRCIANYRKTTGIELRMAIDPENFLSSELYVVRNVYSIYDEFFDFALLLLWWYNMNTEYLINVFTQPLFTTLRERAPGVDLL